MTFIAKYDGRCSPCGEVIETGDTLDWTEDGQAVHEACALDEAADTARPRDICPGCFIELPVIGTCGECG